MVLDAISNMPFDFSIKDLQAQCPTVGIDLIRRILHVEMQDIWNLSVKKLVFEPPRHEGKKP
jgi:hypothetical protein